MSGVWYNTPAQIFGWNAKEDVGIQFNHKFPNNHVCAEFLKTETCVWVSLTDENHGNRD